MRSPDVMGPCKCDFVNVPQTFTNTDKELRLTAAESCYMDMELSFIESHLFIEE